MSHLHFKFLSLKCEVTIMSLEWILRYDKVVSESINKFDMKVYLESVWQWFSKVFLPLKSLLSVFGMKIRCLVSFKKHFWKFGKTLKVIFKESLDRCFFFKTLQFFWNIPKMPPSDKSIRKIFFFFLEINRWSYIVLLLKLSFTQCSFFLLI